MVVFLLRPELLSGWSFDSFQFQEIQKLENTDGLSAADKRFLESLCACCDGKLNIALIYLKESVKSADSNYSRSSVLLKKLEHFAAKKADGDVKFAAKRFDEAIQFYTEALDNITFENDFVLKLLLSRATAYMKIGKFPLALDDYDDVLKIRPSHVEAMLQRAECHQNADNYECAIKCYEAVLTIEAIKDDAEQAKSIRSKIVIASNRRDAKRKFSFGRGYFTIKSYESAATDFNEAILLWPENDLYYEYRATCLMEMHDYQAAFRDYRLLLMKTNVNLCHTDYYRMAKCCLIVGDIFYTEKAIDQLIKSTTSTNDHRLDEYQKELSDLKRFEQNTLHHMKDSGFHSAREYSTNIFLATYFCLLKFSYDSYTVLEANSALEIASESLRFKLLKAECLAWIGRCAVC